MYSYIVLGLPVLVMWPTNFCDSLLQTETRLWEIFILVLLSMRYKFFEKKQYSATSLIQIIPVHYCVCVLHRPICPTQQTEHFV